MNTALTKRKQASTPLFDQLFDRNSVNPSGAEIEHRQPKPYFPGPSFVAEFDEIRLCRLEYEVFQLMRDCQWRTHGEMKARIGHGSETGIAAVLRGLRHKTRGKHTVNKRRRGNPDSGLYEYQLILNPRTKIVPKGRK